MDADIYRRIEGNTQLFIGQIHYVRTPIYLKAYALLTRGYQLFKPGGSGPFLFCRTDIEDHTVAISGWLFNKELPSLLVFPELLFVFRDELLWPVFIGIDRRTMVLFLFEGG